MDRFSIAVRIVLSGISAIAAASRREKPFLAKLTPHNKDTTPGGVFKAVQYTFDLVLSNLVFHNMGKKRLNGYATVFDALKPGAFFVIGDLFPDDKADLTTSVSARY